ncbi:MAG TPA: ATP-binding protein [Pyrinomonadaceae bacterium]|nr:ATP-binding protein [Pyrinomonadaceae bacterium]
MKQKIIKISLSSLCVSLSLSLVVSLVVAAVWTAGLLASLEEAFVLRRAGEQLVGAQAWVTWMLIVATGVGAGLAVARMGARRAYQLVAVVLIFLCGVSLLASKFLHVDIVFVAMAMAALGGMLPVQVWRLWMVDRALARNVESVAARISLLEGNGANARLTGGLKLLDTVLPLTEAVIFRLDETDALAPAARLRSTDTNDAASTDTNRNSRWRASIRQCEQAIKSGELVVTYAETGAHASRRAATAEVNDDGSQTQVSQTSGESPAATVALPLRHEGLAVGALLIRLRGGFEETDRPLLSNVGAQLARDLQRDEARREDAPRNWTTLFSVNAAAHRLESFGVVSGLLREQSFAGLALSEVADGHAVAYLDGTIACVNDAMLDGARLPKERGRKLDLFTLLDCFRTGVFDEPSIAVRRVLQTGEAYERELPFPERGQTLELRIALVSESLPDERHGSAAFTPPNGSTPGHNAPTRPLCLVVTVRDVTRIKEYEKLKSDMISLMSHELRTPITSINGFAELLVMDETLPAEAREFLSIISSESQRLSRMINTFLSVTKLEAADRQEVSKIPLLLDDVVRETMANLQPFAKRKRIRLVEKDCSKLPPVAADRSLITQVVSNLLDNAIKYSPERTTITLSTALEADTVRVVVEDRGYGIPPEAVGRVWEKFYRVARDGHDKEEESTGLGLSFVREVVEQHGGEVSLESEVGRGSKFSFTLPRL